MTRDALRPKNGIVGVVQHGDLFWEQVPEALIHRVVDVVEETAATKRTVPKYVLWTKRAERMARILRGRYPSGTPDFLACAVSAENQPAADERMPFLLEVNTTRIAVIEPMLGPVSLGPYLQGLHWLVVGSETGKPDARSLDVEWVKSLRDEALESRVPFFLKQLGDAHGKEVARILDGRTWDQFPPGFTK